MSKFTHGDAMQLIRKMRVNYGKKFSDQWTGVEPHELAGEMVDQYQGLTTQDFMRGTERMKVEAWPPTIPEFRDWCLGDQRAQWLGANEAWNIARGSIDFNGYELTVVWTKECAIAFDAVADQVKLGDKYQIAEAKKVFVERYERMVAESLERGEKPYYQVSYGDDKEQRKTALKEAEIAGFLKSSESNNLIDMIQTPEDAKKEEIKFKTTAQDHLAKLKAVLKKPNEKQIEELKEKPESFILSSNLPEWADPFDEPDQYKAGIKNDKKAIPLALTEWEKRSGIGS